MKIISSFFSNFQKSKYYILTAIGIVLLVLMATELLHQYRGIPYGDLTRDPNAISQKPKYIGFVSQIGMFFWFGVVSLCILTAILLKRLVDHSLHIQFFQFFAFFTFVLGIDDVFMLHDESAHRGINEKVIYIIYIVCFFYCILRFWKLIFQTNFNLIFIAGFFLGLSILMDVISSTNYIVEDSFKITGIVFWFFYFLDCAVEFVLSASRNKKSELK
jgi:hypothetical protein